MEPTSEESPHPAPGRRAVLVLGMHRSGTSALAGLLSHLGCDAPATSMEADAGNARGYFESRRVYALHNEMLASAGTHWSGWAPLAPDWLASPEAGAFRDRAAGVLDAEFGGSPLFVLKDPRICRTAPIWLGALRDRGVAPLALHVHRHPAEVAASLGRRNGMDREGALLSWLRHVLDAEAATRGLPRAHASYDRLLSDPPATLAAIERGLGLSLNGRGDGAAEDFLSLDLRHHSAEDEALPPWIAATLVVLDRWAARGEDAEGRGALDRVRSALDAATPIFAPIAARARARGGSPGKRGDAALGDGSAPAQETAEADLARRLRELAEAARLLVGMRREIRDLRGRLEAEEARRVAAEARAAADRRARREAETALARSEAHRAAVTASTSWRLTAPLRAVVERVRQP